MPREGRPSKLTDDLQKRIVKLVRERVPPEIAALACGVSRRTYFHWMDVAEERAGRYRDFADAVRAAEAEAEVSCIRQVGAAGSSGRWQAASFLMERRWPSRYSSRTRVVHETDSPQRIQVVFQPPPEANEAA